MLNLDSSDLILDPFPHIIKKGIFEDALARELNATFPEDSFYDEGSVRRQGRRNTLTIRDPNFKAFVDGNATWKAVAQYINSDAFVAKLVAIFSDHIAEQNGWFDPAKCYFSPNRWSEAGRTYQRILSRLNRALKLKDEIHLELAINRSRVGYTVPPHTDGRYKLAIFTIYLNDLDEGEREGGELVLYRHRNRKAPADYERYPALDQVEPIAEVPPVMNTAYFGLNCNNSYHGVKALNLSRGERRFIYGSLNVRNTKDAWH